MSAQAVGTKEKVAARITDNHDGTYTGHYTPKHFGEYELTMSVNGDEGRRSVSRLSRLMCRLRTALRLARVYTRLKRAARQTSRCRQGRSMGVCRAYVRIEKS